LQQG